MTLRLDLIEMDNTSLGAHLTQTARSYTQTPSKVGNFHLRESSRESTYDRRFPGLWRGGNCQLLRLFGYSLFFLHISLSVGTDGGR
jgi:hypothetical protein